MQKRKQVLRGVALHKRREALRRAGLVSWWHRYEKKHPDRKRGELLTEFIGLVKTQRPRERISESSLSRWETQKRRGGLRGLIDGRGRLLTGVRWLLNGAPAVGDVPLHELLRQLAALMRLAADRLEAEAEKRSRGDAPEVRMQTGFAACS